MNIAVNLARLDAEAVGESILALDPGSVNECLGAARAPAQLLQREQLDRMRARLLPPPP